MAKVFNIFADERNDHSKMVKQLLSNQVPPIQRAKSNPRPLSGNHNAGAKPNPVKVKSNKPTGHPAKEEINKTSRCVYTVCLASELDVLKLKFLFDTQGRFSSGVARHEAQVQSVRGNIITFKG
mgnify:FL=1